MPEIHTEHAYSQKEILNEEFPECRIANILYLHNKRNAEKGMTLTALQYELRNKYEMDYTNEELENIISRNGKMFGKDCCDEKENRPFYYLLF